MIPRHYKISLIFLLLILVFSGNVSASNLLIDNSDLSGLEALLKEALSNNAELRAMEQQRASFEARARATGFLEDPRVGLGILNVPVDSFRLDQEPMTQKQITVSQRLPWFGKLDLKTKASVLKVMRQEAVISARRQTLSHDIADAYYELGYVAASQEINAQMAAHLNQIASFAETRYSAGKGFQQDVLRVQVEQSRLVDERHILARQRRVLEDRLNGLLGRETYHPIVPPPPTSLPNGNIAVDQWREMALAHNPELAILEVEVEMADTNVSIAKKEYFPDPNLMLAYGQREDDPSGMERADFLSATLSFTLPIWANRKQGRRLEAAALQRAAAKTAYKNHALQLVHRIDAMAAEIAQIQSSLTLYQEALVIQTEQWAEAALLAYEVGKTDFNSMITAQLRSLTVERQSQNYLFMYHRKSSLLKAAIGGYDQIVNDDSELSIHSSNSVPTS